MKIKLIFAFRSLKYRKVRSIILILGIAISVMLTIGFNIINYSQSRIQLDIAQKLYGNYNSEYKDISTEQLNKIKNIKEVEKLQSVKSFGNLVAKNSTIIKLNSFNKNYLSRKSFDLIKGRFPNKPDEIVLEEKALKDIGLKATVNQNISFRIKKNYMDLYGNHKVFMKDVKLKLVGIISKQKQIDINSYVIYGFCGVRTDVKMIIPKDIVSYDGIFNLNANINNFSEEFDKFSKKVNLTSENCYQNINFVRAQNDYQESKSNKSKNAIRNTVILAAILLIYNLFNMNILNTFYIIKCENSKANNLIVKKNKLITSKKNKFVHGLGILSIESALKKYNGDLVLKELEDSFKVLAYIPLNKVE